MFGCVLFSPNHPYATQLHNPIHKKSYILLRLVFFFSQLKYPNKSKKLKQLSGSIFVIVVVTLPQIIRLTRPLDSWLEHVNFNTLFGCLTDEEVLLVFAAAVLERRIVFIADELGYDVH